MAAAARRRRDHGDRADAAGAHGQDPRGRTRRRESIGAARCPVSRCRRRRSAARHDGQRQSSTSSPRSIARSRNASSRNRPSRCSRKSRRPRPRRCTCPRPSTLPPPMRGRAPAIAAPSLVNTPDVDMQGTTLPPERASEPFVSQEPVEPHVRFAQVLTPQPQAAVPQQALVPARAGDSADRADAAAIPTVARRYRKTRSRSRSRRRRWPYRSVASASPSRRASCRRTISPPVALRSASWPRPCRCAVRRAVSRRGS